MWPVKPFETVTVIKGYTNKIHLTCVCLCMCMNIWIHLITHLTNTMAAELIVPVISDRTRGKSDHLG